MLENEMKISLTLVAFDKMSKVLRDAVHSSNSLFKYSSFSSLSTKTVTVGFVL